MLCVRPRVPASSPVCVNLQGRHLQKLREATGRGGCGGISCPRMGQVQVGGQNKAMFVHMISKMSLL